MIWRKRDPQKPTIIDNPASIFEYLIPSSFYFYFFISLGILVLKLNLPVTFETFKNERRQVNFFAFCFDLSTENLTTDLEESRITAFNHAKVFKAGFTFFRL